MQDSRKFPFGPNRRDYFTEQLLRPGLRHQDRSCLLAIQHKAVSLQNVEALDDDDPKDCDLAENQQASRADVRDCREQ